MSDDKKVVSLMDRLQDKKREEEGMVPLPEEYREVINQQEADVEGFVEMLHTSISAYVDSSPGTFDVTIPMDALARVTADIAVTLDSKVDPEQLPLHHDTRAKMIKSMVSIADQMIEGSPTPVFTQDVYLCLANTMIHFLNRYRYYQTINGHYKTGADTDGETGDESSQRSDES